ncbi:MAG TPA: hypothetical protein VHE59_16865 [Mucilaginibacter sp.]|nr:hypothetical protein [Mucilaginibacter sp.]
MDRYALIFMHLACAAVLFSAACSGRAGNKLHGDWKAVNSKERLKITDKKFVPDGDEALAEDYFIKGDTIYTSFDGNQPYSKFVVQMLDDHHLKLLSPDSEIMEYTR